MSIQVESEHLMDFRKKQYGKNPFSVKFRNFDGNFVIWAADSVNLLEAKYVLGKILNFCNMLLAPRFNPAKNLEKAHIREIGAKIGQNFAENGEIWANPYYKS